MNFPVNELYDLSRDRFITPPIEVQERLEQQLRSLPPDDELADAMKSVLTDLAGEDHSGAEACAKETLHLHGDIAGWRQRLNDMEDKLRAKGASELAPIKNPLGVPMSLTIKEPGIGTLRVIAYVDWMESDWDAAHVGIAFTAVIVKRHPVRFP